MTTGNQNHLFQFNGPHMNHGLPTRFLLLWSYPGKHQDHTLQYSQQTCHTAGRWAAGWAVLWSTPYTKSWRSGCPAGTHLCSGPDSRRFRTHPCCRRCTDSSLQTHTDKGSTQLQTHNLTSASVCWTTLQTACRFHPRLHVPRQTHCSIAAPGELWAWLSKLPFKPPMKCLI